MCACAYYSPVREKLMPLAEELRAAISLPINYPVLIIGDASSSMSVAVRTATIIAGFIASVCPEGECNLRFFNQGLLPAPYVPRDLTGILDVASKVKANGMTTNAAGLYDVYTVHTYLFTFSFLFFFKKKKPTYYCCYYF